MIESYLLSYSRTNHLLVTCPKFLLSIVRLKHCWIRAMRQSCNTSAGRKKSENASVTQCWMERGRVGQPTTCCGYLLLLTWFLVERIMSATLILELLVHMTAQQAADSSALLLFRTTSELSNRPQVPLLHKQQEHQGHAWLLAHMWAHKPWIYNADSLLVQCKQELTNIFF